MVTRIIPFLICSGLAILTGGFLVSAVMGLLDWIPNIMEQSFRHSPIRLGRYSCNSYHRSCT